MARRLVESESPLTTAFLPELGQVFSAVGADTLAVQLVTANDAERADRLVSEVSGLRS